MIPLLLRHETVIRISIDFVSEKRNLAFLCDKHRTSNEVEYGLLQRCASSNGKSGVTGGSAVVVALRSDFVHIAPRFTKEESCPTTFRDSSWRRWYRD
jgi:hypothetical protein